MRPGQNRRMRGRNRNKGPNPLTRSYESNGPDVKIRGTAQHVADKYAQLARDAQAGGDPIAAENYFQHAEHYYRVIAAAQEQFRPQLAGGQRPFDEDGEELEDEGGGYGQPGAERGGFGDEAPYGQGFEARGGGDRQPFGRPDRPNRFPQGGQQRFDRDRGGYDRGPGPDRAGGYDRGAGPDRPGGYDRAPDRQGGYDRGAGPERGERFDRANGDRYDRQNGERFDRRAGNGGRDGFGPRGPRGDRDAGRGDRDDRAGGDQRPFRADRGQEGDEPRDEPAPGDLPAFLTAPVRTISVPETGDEPGTEIRADEGFGASGHDGDNGGGGNGARRRRRQPRKAENGGEAAHEAPRGGTAEDAAE